MGSAKVNWLTLTSVKMLKIEIQFSIAAYNCTTIKQSLELYCVKCKSEVPFM